EKNSLWRPSESGRTVVCSLHFTADAYKENVKIKKLKTTAVPTVFENYPIHKQCNSKHNRKPPATRLAPAPPPHKRR
ncbi:hypothetical protein HPB47_002576, partial [Ixodes persulcatus]